MLVEGMFAWALILAPAAAAGREAPHAIALELGFNGDPGLGAGGATSVGVAVNAWLTGELDATGRVAWASALRPDGRGADAAFEAGAGLRDGMTTWRAAQLQVAVAAAWRQPGAWPSSAAGLRLEIGGGIEVALAGPVGLGLALEASQGLFTLGGAPGLGGRLRLACYF
jgi:hypothetical protein